MLLEGLIMLNFMKGIWPKTLLVCVLFERDTCATKSTFCLTCAHPYEPSFKPFRPWNYTTVLVVLLAYDNINEQGTSKQQ